LESAEQTKNELQIKLANIINEKEALNKALN